MADFSLALLDKFSGKSRFRVEESADPSTFLELQLISAEAGNYPNAIVDYPVLGGTIKTDNVRRQPAVFMVRGLITDSVVSQSLGNTSQDLFNPEAQRDLVSDALKTIQKFRLDGTTVNVYAYTAYLEGYAIKEIHTQLSASKVNALEIIVKFRQIIVALSAPNKKNTNARDTKHSAISNRGKAS